MAVAVWTSTTLAAQVLKEVGQNLNAGGGTPTSLLGIVEEAAGAVWHAHPWVFRRSSTGSAGAYLYSAIDDTAVPGWEQPFYFGWHLCASWMAAQHFAKPEYAQTTKVAYFDWLAKQIESDTRETATAATTLGRTVNDVVKQILVMLGLKREGEAGEAVLALVLKAGSAVWTAYPWRFRVNDIDGPDFTFDIDPFASATGATDPGWGGRFDTGWEIYATMMAAASYGRADVAKANESLWNNWLQTNIGIDEALLDGDAPGTATLDTIDGIAEGMRALLGLPRHTATTRQTVEMIRRSGAAVWHAHPWRFRRNTDVAPNWDYDDKDFDALGTTTKVGWPTRFNTGWVIYSQWMLAAAFGKAAVATASESQWEHWLDSQIRIDEAHLDAEAVAAGDLKTVNGLAETTRASLDLPRHGDITRQIVEIVREAAVALWTSYDWRFRLKSGTLSCVANTEVAALPADFAELDSRWLKNYNEQARLRFTEDVAVYQSFRDQYDSTDTSIPRLACITQDISEAVFAWEVRVAPTPSENITFPFWYLKKDPWHVVGTILADTVAPVWPETFFRGWRLLAKLSVAKEFPGQGDAKDRSYSYARDEKAWNAWLGQQMAENDETIRTGDAEYIDDGYGDDAAVGMGVPGSDQWLL